MRSISSIFMVFFCLSASAETLCIWKAPNGLINEIKSESKSIDNIVDCVNDTAIAGLIYLSPPGLNRYDGIFQLSDEQGKVLDSCESKTVRQMDQDEINDLLQTIFGSSKTFSESERLELLRTKIFQAMIKSHIQIRCNQHIS